MSSTSKPASATTGGAVAAPAKPARRFVIDEQHPWPWLEAFPESAKAFFNGRDDDAKALLRALLAAPVTVLYGKSGHGKSSLLQAGLFPRMRRERLLPVYVRLAQGADAPPLPAQFAARLRAAIAATATADDKADVLSVHDEGGPIADAAWPADDLWSELHSADRWLADGRRRRWQPVFVVDQFEESFTLGSVDPLVQDRMFNQLGDLLENRIPPDVAERIEADDDYADSLLTSIQTYRVLVSLREDFLPDLDARTRTIPRLGPNRVRLLAMSPDQALEAVVRTGGALVTPEDADRIVAYLSVSPLRGNAVGARKSEVRGAAVEPVLLSMLCSGLNETRIERGLARLETRRLESDGGLIVEGFYDKAVAGSAKAASFVQTRLITTDGSRLPYPETSALNSGEITPAEIDTLIDTRLIRRETLASGDHLELVHDRLAAVAARRRREAIERARLAELAAAQRKQQRNARIALVATLIGLAGLAAFLGWRGEENRLAREVAEALVQKSQAAEKKANDAVIRAIDGEAEAERAKASLQSTFQALEAEKRSVETALRRASAAEQSTARERDLAQTLARENLAQGAAIAGANMAAGDQRGGTFRGLMTLLAAQDLVRAGSSAAPVVEGYLASEYQKQLRLESLHGVAGQLISLATAGDGRRLATGSADGTVRLWDAAGGKPLGEPWTAHTDPVNAAVNALAFSPDGRQLVSASANGSLKRWDVATRQELGPASSGHKAGISAVVFTSGAQWVSAGLDGSLRAWDAQTGQPIGKAWLGAGGPVASLAASPDGRSVVSGGFDGRLRWWNPATGEPIGKAVPAHDGAVRSLAFSHDGRTLASGGRDKLVRLWRVAAEFAATAPNTAESPIQAMSQVLRGHDELVLGLAFDPSDRRLVSGSADRTLRLWNVTEASAIGDPWRGHGDWVCAVGFGAGGRQVVSVSADGTLRLWNAADQVHPGTALRGHSARVTRVAFNPIDRSRLLTAGADNSLRLWNASTGEPVGLPWTGHTDSVLDIAFSPDGRRVVSAGADQTIRLWDLGTGTQIGGPWRGHTAAVSSVAFAADGATVASGSWDHTLRLWNAATGTPIGTPWSGHNDWVTAVAFSRDGRRVLSGSRDRTLRLWNARDGSPVGKPWEGHTHWVTSVAFSPDGRSAVSGSRDYTVRRWSVATGQPDGQPWTGHTSQVSSVAYSPDGTRVLSGSYDTSLQLWDAQSGRAVGDAWRGHREPVNDVGFDSTGTVVASASDDKTVMLWPARSGWVDRLCAKLHRNPSPAEWRQWLGADVAFKPPCPGLDTPADTPLASQPAAVATSASRPARR